MLPEAQLRTYIMINPMKDLEASIPTLNWFAIREGKGSDARAPTPELSSSSRLLQTFFPF
jgi:hypothetical protein